MRKAFIFLAVVALLLMTIVPLASAGPGKVDVCHLAGPKGNKIITVHNWVKIRVGPSAVDAHLAHGDYELEPGESCP